MKDLSLDQPEGPKCRGLTDEDDTDETANRSNGRGDSASCDLERFKAMLASHAFANNHAKHLMHKSCADTLTDIC